jgi:hypothetical protein
LQEERKRGREEEEEEGTFSEISLRNLQESINSRFLNVDTFSAADSLNSGPGTFVIEWLEPEFRASGSQWLNDSADIVADDTEASDLGILLHGSPQSVLCILCH